MKEGIHPNYQVTTVKCACGNNNPATAGQETGVDGFLNGFGLQGVANHCAEIGNTVIH